MNDVPSILYVEDDLDIAEMYRIGLERGGFRLTIAGDWPAGQRLLRRRSFDLVLLDIMLPGPDGMAALAELRSMPGLADLPVAVLSNSELSPEVHQRARDLRVLAWMVKSKSPPPAVVRTIRRWASQGRLTGRARGA